MVQLIRASGERMSGLISNLLDFARGRLGGGVPVVRNPEILGPVLAAVVAELRAGRPDRAIDAKFDLPVAVDCDRGRMEQLFSNLLSNALDYGAPDAPIRVRAGVVDGAFELSVANAGDPIPTETQQSLFHPYFRGTQHAAQGGLGLGLYIAHEIAKAHGGTLAVASSPAETRFTFRMPLAA
jgi:signal transduction histidine kinase